jgi:hypothetical protein
VILVVLPQLLDSSGKHAMRMMSDEAADHWRLSGKGTGVGARREMSLSGTATEEDKAKAERYQEEQTEIQKRGLRKRE